MSSKLNDPTRCPHQSVVLLTAFVIWPSGGPSGQWWIAGSTLASDDRASDETEEIGDLVLGSKPLLREYEDGGCRVMQSFVATRWDIASDT